MKQRTQKSSVMILDETDDSEEDTITNVRRINASYGRYKIHVDGKECTLTDGHGKLFEPFVHDGEFYAPLGPLMEYLKCIYAWDVGRGVFYISLDYPLHFPKELGAKPAAKPAVQPAEGDPTGPYPFEGH